MLYCACSTYKIVHLIIRAWETRHWYHRRQSRVSATSRGTVSLGLPRSRLGIIATQLSSLFRSTCTQVWSSYSWFILGTSLVLGSACAEVLLGSQQLGTSVAIDLWQSDQWSDFAASVCIDGPCKILVLASLPRYAPGAWSLVQILLTSSSCPSSNYQLPSSYYQMLG